MHELDEPAWALLIVDAQVSGSVAPDANVASNIVALANLAKAEGAIVIAVESESMRWADYPGSPASTGSHSPDTVTPLAGLSTVAYDYRLKKTGLSAFRGTPLDDLAQKHGVLDFLVAGGPVQHALSSTLRDGVGRGYSFIVVADACLSAEGSDLYITQIPHLAKVERTAAMLGGRPFSGPELMRAATPALILIDLQERFLRPRRGQSSAEAVKKANSIVASASAAATTARARGWPVFVVEWIPREDMLDNATEPVGAEPRQRDASGGWGLHPGLVTAPTDLRIHKVGRSVFQFTPLDRMLRALNVRTCVFAGGAVRGCLSSSVRDAYDGRLDSIVLLDAVYPADSAYLPFLKPFAVQTTTHEYADLAESSSRVAGRRAMAAARHSKRSHHAQRS